MEAVARDGSTSTTDTPGKLNVFVAAIIFVLKSLDQRYTLHKIPRNNEIDYHRVSLEILFVVRFSY